MPPSCQSLTACHHCHVTEMPCLVASQANPFGSEIGPLSGPESFEGSSPLENTMSDSLTTVRGLVSHEAREVNPQKHTFSYSKWYSHGETISLGGQRGRTQ